MAQADHVAAVRALAALSDAVRIGAALAHLAAWEAAELASAKPCPDLLDWARGARADLEAHGAAATMLAEVEAFADHLATLEA